MRLFIDTSDSYHPPILSWQICRDTNTISFAFLVTALLGLNGSIQSNEREWSGRYVSSEACGMYRAWHGCFHACSVAVFREQALVVRAFFEVCCFLRKHVCVSWIAIPANGCLRNERSKWTMK